MRFWKRVGGLFAVYVVLVVIFEAGYLGAMQPSFEEGCIPMLVVTARDENAKANSKMLARFETDGKLYVSAHHWTRGWYKRAMANPEVYVEVDGVRMSRITVPIAGEEFEAVAAAFPIPLRARILMGFPPPRDTLRLDLAESAT
ncbi:MAG: hypothetical protein QF515_18835 [Pseudomonadales bacterium]|jgi:hypothetical protein|nr:hypothetical protein [Pseudomonadales bacterium]MDP6469979.1 hypothetical protein [Pseudomonadales bacterium]MDP6829147.1 hypothetical protein [Pseudomonadales bacterium]|tara:strand:- start:891 stop:1322 length:432 start_codon:yes stop_codon:yes gene_type:complete